MFELIRSLVLNALKGILESCEQVCVMRRHREEGHDLLNVGK